MKFPGNQELLRLCWYEASHLWSAYQQNSNLTDTKMRLCLLLIEAGFDVTVSLITTQTAWEDKAVLALIKHLSIPLQIRE